MANCRHDDVMSINNSHCKGAKEATSTINAIVVTLSVKFSHLHWPVQGHLRSLILIPIKSLYMTSY